MPTFLSPALRDLARQLIYTPADRARRQMQQAEDLYWQIDPGQDYPLDFLIYRITRFRPESVEAITLSGLVVRHDLMALVEYLSGAVKDTAWAYDPPPQDLAAMGLRLKVSAKTLSRYRRQGLFARKLRFKRGRPRLGFLQPSVERFLSHQRRKLEKAARFSRLGEDDRHELLLRARRLAARTGASPFQVARHLAPKYRRSVETLRRLLVLHDRRNPRTPIFRAYSPALSARDLRVIHRAYRRGIPITRIARRFGRTRGVIYRALNLYRAAQLKKLDLRFIPYPTFDLPDADQVILDSPLPAPSRPTAKGIDAQTETALFVRYSYLKHKAARLIRELDPYHPRASTIDLIETLLRHKETVKRQLVEAYLRLVASVAGKHLAGWARPHKPLLEDLTSEGHIVLLETLETFDAGRGNRFSTYLTWALMKRYAQESGTRILPSASEFQIQSLPARPLEQEPQPLHAETQTLMGRLDERERFILSHHFGLTDPQTGRPRPPQTLAQLAGQLGISPERARQIEHRALKKLRKLSEQ